jgi:restriction system protein
MARRSSLFDDLMTATAKLPWWIGVLVAIVSYLGFHAIASQPNALAPKTVEGLGEFSRAQLFKTMAIFLQYLLPVAFLFGAAASLISRGKKRDSVDLFDAGDIASSGEGCPICGSPMKVRIARRGGSRGERFYGCSKFPKCRGTRS